MTQVGTIVIHDKVNTQAVIELLKKEDTKISFDKEQITKEGIKYIPIEKN